MMKSLSNVSLISYPNVSYMDEKEFVRNFNADQIRLKIRDRLGQISKVMKENKVRVANLSYGSSYNVANDHLLSSHPWYQRLFIKGRVHDVAKAYSRLNFEEHERFFTENPDTIFVIAAGNDGNNLEFESNHTAKIEHPNVIKVANLSYDGKLSGSSNRSDQFVQIGAIGEGVESLRIGATETLFMSGTSQAAPKVTNTLIEIFQKNSALTVTQALNELYQNYTYQNADLERAIKGGRTLKENFRSCSQIFLK